MHKHGQLGMGMRIRCRLRPSSRRRCRLLGGDTAAFCASLVEGLAHLESTLEVDHQSGTVSMWWCVDAMRLVKRMQREMLAIFRKADVPVAAGAGAAGDWFEHYMQETAALLDFCNAFKAAVSRMHRYCMVVDFSAQVIVGRAEDGGTAAASLVVESVGAAPATAEPCQAQAASLAAFRDKMADAKAAVAEAERLERAIIVSGAGRDDASGMVVVTLIAKITTSVLSMFVLQALTAPPATVDDNGGVQPTIASAVAVDVDVVPELEPWCESLSLIHARFPSPAAVAEHEKVAMAVRDLVNGKVGSGGHGEQQEELLRARSGELREGVEMLDSVLDEVFDEVIRGRNEMLGILRDKALT